MKLSCFPSLLAAGALLVLTFPASADTPKLRNAIEMLQGAKKASDPMPMLQSARKLLNEANKGDKNGDRMEAVKLVKEAIAELRTGDKVKMEQKINAAIANIHQGKDKSK